MSNIAILFCALCQAGGKQQQQQRCIGSRRKEMSFFKDTALKDEQQAASSNPVNNFFKTIRDRVADVVIGDKPPAEKPKKATASDKSKEKVSKDKDGAASPERKPKKNIADKGEKLSPKKEGKKDSTADGEAKTSEGINSTSTGKKGATIKLNHLKYLNLRHYWTAKTLILANYASCRGMECPRSSVGWCGSCYWATCPRTRAAGTRPWLASGKSIWTQSLLIITCQRPTARPRRVKSCGRSS